MATRTLSIVQKQRQLFENLAVENSRSSSVPRYSKKITVKVLENSVSLDNEIKTVRNEVQGGVIKPTIAVRHRSLPTSKVYFFNKSKDTINAKRYYQNKNVEHKLTEIIKKLCLTEEQFISAFSFKVFNIVSSQHHDLQKRFEDIYDFHNDVFLPALIQCGSNIDKIADILVMSMDTHFCYLYSAFALYIPYAELLQDKYPMKRLQQYQLTIEEILKIIEENLDYFGSGELSKVKGKYEEAHELISEILLVMSKALEFKNIYHDRRKLMLSIRNHGRLLNIKDLEELVEVQDKGHSFKSRIFLFEKILIYTRYNPNRDKFVFQGYFKCDNIVLYSDDASNRIYIENSNCQIAFTCDYKNFHKWMRDIRFAIEKSSSASLPLSPGLMRTAHIYRTVNELLTTEETYISALEHGINNYMSLMEDKLLSSILLEQKFKIFSVIKPIYEFHKYQLLPALKKCNTNVHMIAETFRKFINSKSFYNYILYTANKPHSAYFYEKHRIFFALNEKKIGDKLGMETFLIFPIQRLPKYCLIFDSLIHEVSSRNSFSEYDRETIKSCCLAQKEIQTLIDTANDALILSEADNACGNYCMNVWKEGLLIQCVNVNICSSKDNRKNDGKLFLFDNFIVFMEYSNGKYALQGYCKNKQVTFLKTKIDNKLKDVFIVELGLQYYLTIIPLEDFKFNWNHILQQTSIKIRDWNTGN